MKQFTSGPWIINKQYAIIEDKSANCIAAIHAQSGDGISPEIARHNADLIAAAPDMYEALKSIMESIRIGDDKEPIVDYYGFSDIAKGAYAALAKAEGE